MDLPQLSVKFHVSVNVPQIPSPPEITDMAEPLIKQAPLPPLVKVNGEETGGMPQTCDAIFPAAANSAAGAGFTTIVLVLVMVCPHTVAVHDSVTLPPQAPGIVPSVDVADPLNKQSPERPLV